MSTVPKFFDVHTHVQFAAFKDDADLVIQRALEAGADLNYFLIKIEPQDYGA